MIIRYGTVNDVDDITNIEARCFSEADRASWESMNGRMNRYSEGFWVLERDGKIAAFINGILSDEKDLNDDMYNNPQRHISDGRRLFILSVATAPEYRHRGYAGKLMNRVISDMKAQNKEQIVLTCKEHMIGFYSLFGFKNEGVSESKHGGSVWYQMRLYV